MIEGILDGGKEKLALRKDGKRLLPVKKLVEVVSFRAVDQFYWRSFDSIIDF